MPLKILVHYGFITCLLAKWVDCLFGFYGISTFVGYSMPNLFLYKETVLFQIIQFSQTVLIQTIQFNISIVFVHTVKCQNSSISNNTV